MSFVLLSISLTSALKLVKTFLSQEFLKRGILCSDTIYVSVAHTKKILNKYYKVVDIIFKKLSKFRNNSDLLKNIETDICLDNLVVDGTGAVTSVTVVIGGSGHAIDDTIIVTDSQLGGGGAPHFTMDVATLLNAADFTMDVATNTGTLDKVLIRS